MILTTENRGDAWHPGLRSSFWLHTNQKDQKDEWIFQQQYRCDDIQRRNRAAISISIVHLDLKFSNLLQGTYSEGRVHRHPAGELGGSETAASNLRIGTTGNLRCFVFQATCHHRVFLKDNQIKSKLVNLLPFYSSLPFQ